MLKPIAGCRKDNEKSWWHTEGSLSIEWVEMEKVKKTSNKLNSLKARKIKVGKKWYWDLKPDYRFREEIRIGQ